MAAVRDEELAEAEVLAVDEHEAPLALELEPLRLDGVVDADEVVDAVIAEIQTRRF